MTEEKATLEESLAAAFEGEAEDVAPEVTEPVAQHATEEEVIPEVTIEAPPEGEPQADLSPPENWSQEDKDAFGAVDRQSQEFALRIEKQFKSGFTEKTEALAREREQYEKLDGIMKQYGIDPQFTPQVIETFFNYRAGLTNPQTRQQAYEALQRDFPLATPAPEEEYADPSLTQAVEPLKQQIQALQEQLQQVTQSTTQMQSNTVQVQVDTFKNATDADGKLLHPHFDAVESEMAMVVQGKPGTSLADAYDAAVYINPEIRQQVFDAQKEMEKAAAESERKEKTKAAKAAESKIVKGNKTASAAAEDKAKQSLEETMRGEWDTQVSQQ